MVLDVLLTLGLLLSTASQLRPDGAPVGPGEICLAVWVLLMLFREVGRLGPALTPPLARLLIFWLVFAVAQCVGTMAGFAIGDRHDSGLFMHDVMAYPLLAAVSCLSVAGSRLHRVAWLLATLGAAWLALQVAFGWGFVDLGDYDTWEWERFRGLSDNANQLALFCAVLSLLSLYLADAARRLGERIAAVTCMIVAIIVGRLTMSDAFLLVLVAAGPIFIALKLRRWLMSRDRQMPLRSASAWILVLALPLVMAYAVPLGASATTEFEDFIKGMTKGGGGRDTEESSLVCASISGMRRCAGASSPGCWAWGLARILKSRPLSWPAGGFDQRPKARRASGFRIRPEFRSAQHISRSLCPRRADCSLEFGVARGNSSRRDAAGRAGRADDVALRACHLQHLPPDRAPSDLLVCDLTLLGRCRRSPQGSDDSG